MTSRTTIIKNENERFERAPVNSKRPTRPTDSRDVEVAIYAALGAMFFVFLAFVAIILVTETDITAKGLGVTLLISVGIGFLFFIVVLKYSLQAVYAIEQVVGIDINGDGRVSELSRPYKVTMNGKNKQKDENRIWQDGFYQFVSDVFDGNITHHSNRGKFSEEQIVKYRSYLVDLGIAKFKSSRNHQLELLVSREDAELMLEATPWYEITKDKQKK